MAYLKDSENYVKSAIFTDFVLIVTASNAMQAKVSLNMTEYTREPMFSLKGEEVTYMIECGEHIKENR